jgi:hypothetical protein
MQQSGISFYSIHACFYTCNNLALSSTMSMFE